MSPAIGAKTARSFGLTVGAAFLVLAAVSRWRGSPNASVAFVVIGGALGVAALVHPPWLIPIERGWMRGAALLSKVTTPIFMGVIYFAVFTPVGIARRMLGKTTLARADTSRSFWVRRPPGSRRSDLERQF
ncbi:MAG: hypothetical protein ABI328_03005 [Gemmatimonadaceae bacterium]